MHNTHEKVYRTFAEKFVTLERLPGYLTVEEAAAVIGVSRSSIYRYIASGKLPGARFGSIIAVSEEDAQLQLRKRADKTALSPAHTKKAEAAHQQETSNACGQALV